MGERVGEKFTFASLVAIVSFFFYMWIARCLSVDGNLVKNPKDLGVSNLMLFFCGLILFAIVLAFSLYYSFRIGNIEFGIPFAYGVFFCEIVYLILAYMFEGQYTSINQTENCFRQICPKVVFIMMVVLGVFVIKRTACKNYDRTLILGKINIVRFLVTSICTALVSYLYYEPNPFADKGGRIYHVHAYVNSIINANHFEPYSYEVNSIYGHYGILYILPTKFIHLFTENKWDAFAISIMLVGALSFLAFSYVIHKLVKSDVLFSLAEMSLATWSFSTSGGELFSTISA